MKGSLRARCALLFVCLWLAPPFLPGCAVAQSAVSVTLSGDVLDSTGAAIPGATVTLHRAGGDQTTTSDGVGHFMFSVPAGRYDLVISDAGFRTYTRFGMMVGSRLPPLKATLEIATNEEQVNVNASENALSNDASANKSALVFKGDQLDTFSDDPATMQQELVALGGGDPTNPPQIYVDGFSNGTMPPKEAIREIRINQNPFSAAYDQFGIGRIEILTKPGANKLHGSIESNFGSNALDTNAFSAIHTLNPNVSVPGQPAYTYSYLYGSLNGPIGKNSSFYLSVVRNELANNALVDAATSLDSSGNYVYTNQAVPDPTLNQTYSFRFDRQFGKNDTLVSRYTLNNSSQTNAGVGLLVLADDGYHSSTRTQTLQMTETHLFGSKVVLDSGLQYIRTRSRQDPNSTVPGIAVSGAFNAGGNPSQSLHDDLDRLELQQYYSISEGKHFIRTGLRSRITRDANYENENYNGVFTFPSLLAYQITQRDLALGKTDAQIRADCQTIQGTTTCGGATQVSIATGNPQASLFTSDTEVYGEDEWKFTPNLTLNYGVRLETESAIPNHLDAGPRVGFAWSLFPNKKTKQPLFVLRSGFGIFYQRFASSNILTAIRQNGTSQQSFNISNPDADVYNPNAAKVPSPTSLSGTKPSPYLINPHLKSPAQNQYYGSLEHSFGKIGNINFAGYLRRTNHMYESLNINAPLPGTYVYSPTGGSGGVYPYGTSQAIYEFSSDGVSNGHVFSTNVNLNLSKKLSYWGFLSFGHQESDVAGNGFGQSVASFPSNSYDVKADAGPLSTFAARQLYSGGQYKPGWDTSINFFFSARSSQHFNITTGTDLNGDTQYNDRPAFATHPTSASQIYTTKWGTFDANPQPGEAIIPNNYGTTSPFTFLSLYLTKNFRFGPRPPAPAPAANAASAKPGEKHDLPLPRYRLQIAASADNVLNHVNPGPPVGVLTSPNFGKPISLNSPFVSNSAANRSVELRAAFYF